MSNKTVAESLNALRPGDCLGQARKRTHGDQQSPASADVCVCHRLRAGGWRKPGLKGPAGLQPGFSKVSARRWKPG
jgi:hypothetical protein